MNRRHFTLGGVVLAARAHQIVSTASFEPQSTIDLIDPATHELTELVGSEGLLWGLARKLHSRTAFSVVRAELLTRKRASVILPDGFYRQMSLVRGGGVAVWGASPGQNSLVSRWDVSDSLSLRPRPEQTNTGRAVGSAYCGDRFVSASSDGSLIVRTENAGDEGTTFKAFPSEPLDGYYPSALPMSVVPVPPATVFVVEHFGGRIARLDLASMTLKAAIRIADPSIDAAIEKSKRYLSTVKDSSAAPGAQYRRAVTPAVLAAVCPSTGGGLWALAALRRPETHLLLLLNENGEVIRRVNCALPGGSSARDKVAVFVATSGTRLHLGYWGGRVHTYQTS